MNPPNLLLTSHSSSLPAKPVIAFKSSAPVSSFVSSPATPTMSSMHIVNGPSNNINNNKIQVNNVISGLPNADNEKSSTVLNTSTNGAKQIIGINNSGCGGSVDGANNATPLTVQANPLVSSTTLVNGQIPQSPLTSPVRPVVVSSEHSALLNKPRAGIVMNNNTLGPGIGGLGSTPRMVISPQMIGARPGSAGVSLCYI